MRMACLLHRSTDLAQACFCMCNILCLIIENLARKSLNLRDCGAQGEWLQAQVRGVQDRVPALQLHVRCPEALASAAGHVQWGWQYLCQRLGASKGSAPAT